MTDIPQLTTTPIHHTYSNTFSSSTTNRTTTLETIGYIDYKSSNIKSNFLITKAKYADEKWVGSFRYTSSSKCDDDNQKKYISVPLHSISCDNKSTLKNQHKVEVPLNQNVSSSSSIWLCPYSPNTTNTTTTKSVCTKSTTMTSVTYMSSDSESDDIDDDSNSDCGLHHLSSLSRNDLYSRRRSGSDTATAVTKSSSTKQSIGQPLEQSSSTISTSTVGTCRSSSNSITHIPDHRRQQSSLQSIFREKLIHPSIISYTLESSSSSISTLPINIKHQQKTTFLQQQQQQQSVLLSDTILLPKQQGQQQQVSNNLYTTNKQYSNILYNLSSDDEYEYLYDNNDDNVYVYGSDCTLVDNDLETLISTTSYEWKVHTEKITSQTSTFKLMQQLHDNTTASNDNNDNNNNNNNSTEQSS